MISSTPFILSLYPRVWKLLPMRNQQDEGQEVYLYRYTNSLTKELMGALETYPELHESAYYISIVNTIQYLGKYTTSPDEWRAEVLKVLNIQKKLRREFTGVESEAEE